MGRRLSRALARMVSSRRLLSAWSPWLKLSRNTSTPAAHRACIASRSLLAGPRVTTDLGVTVTVHDEVPEVVVCR